MEIEAGLLALLRFEEPSEVEAFLATRDPNTLDATARVRLFLARGIAANRLRDPIAALRWLSQAIDLARAGADPQLSGEALLERARVQSWMGSFARSHEDLADVQVLATEAALLRLPLYLRYAEMYAEAERWPQAARFIARALPLAKEMQHSIHAWQLHDCAIRVGQATGEDTQEHVQALQKDAAHLPDYLAFRLTVARARDAFLRNNVNDATDAVAAVTSRVEKLLPECYERAVATGLSGELALLKGDANAALPQLAEAGQWFEARDLAVPRITLALLEAKAFIATGQRDAAARLLTRLRDYCAKRGLQLQREAIEVAQREHGLPRMADVEQGRVAGANAWAAARAYVIQERLGQGGQGTVYRAHDTARDRPVAFKTLALPPGPEAFRILQHEVEALCRAQVPGVARIIACGTAEDGQAYLVQDLVGGTSLRHAKMTDHKEHLRILTDLSSTLDQLHAQGLSHGDIKPDNVMLDESRKPVLVDFGAARFNHAQHTPNAATRAYLPQGWRARFMTPVQRDHYAFGLLLQDALKDNPHHPLLRQLLKPLPFVSPRPLQPRMTAL